MGPRFVSSCPVAYHHSMRWAGCDPASQGKGLGGATIRSGLERVADSGLPAYLETPSEKYIGFYRGLGFEVTGEWAVPKGGPRFWSMMRPAD